TEQQEGVEGPEDLAQPQACCHLALSTRGQRFLEIPDGQSKLGCPHRKSLSGASAVLPRSHIPATASPPHPLNLGKKEVPESSESLPPAFLGGYQ
ncbi:Hypothetical predicted protein, partial [Marmota monax]